MKSAGSRASFIRAKLNVLIPSQIRALRLRRDNMTQKQLAAIAKMAQPRISAMERPGATKFNIETLVRLAAAFKVGLKVEFVPFSEMLAWENDFSQDEFDAVKIDKDIRFISPTIHSEAATITSAPALQLNFAGVAPVNLLVPEMSNWFGPVTASPVRSFGSPVVIISGQSPSTSPLEYDTPLWKGMLYQDVAVIAAEAAKAGKTNSYLSGGTDGK